MSMDSSHIRIIHTFVFIIIQNSSIMKLKVLIPALSLITVALASCNSNPQSVSDSNAKFTVCDFASVDNNTIELPLSDLVEDCQLIRFENTDAALFKAWTVTATDNYIGIRQSGAPYKLFNKQGKYLCDVGAIGNGPGEYSISIYDEIIDEKGGHIFFSSFVGDKIMMYDLNGKWIKDIKLPLKINKPKIALNDDGTLSVVHMSFEEKDPFAFCVDMDGKITKQILTPAHMKVGDFNGEIFSHQNGPDFEFTHTSNDTLFAYNAAENRLEPHFAMNFPKENKPIHIYMELPTCYFANCYYWDNEKQRPSGGGTYMIDKKTGKAVKFNLVNDFFGNMPTYYSFNKGYYLSNIEPGSLKEKIEELLSSGKCPDKDKEKMKELAASLHENDNNVLFIGKLKQ